MKPIVLNTKKRNEETDALLKALLATNNNEKLRARNIYSLPVRLPLSSSKPVDLLFELTHTITPDLSYKILFLEKERKLSKTELLPFTVKIDPTKLDRQGKALLSFFLESNPEKIKVKAQRTYPLQVETNTESPQRFKLLLEFTSNLLIRPRESEPSQKRIEVESGFLGQGGFGQVSLSKGVIEVENDMHFKIKERVIKKIPLKKAKEKQIIKEARNTQTGSDFLHCKSALFGKKSGYLVMKKAPGEDLLEVINKLRIKEIHLTVKEYMQLSLAIMRAVNDLHKKDRVHRDLKPENLIIDLLNMRVTIIDHALNKEIIGSRQSKRPKGTVLYLAPETLSQMSYSKASDLFALGHILGVLWGDEALYSLADHAAMAIYAWSWRDDRFTNLFEGMSLSEDMKKALNTLFHDLTSPAAHKRNLEEAIELCERLLYELENGSSFQNRPQ